MLFSKLNKLWFTLIEIMVWILIVSIVIIWWFQALTSVNIWKVRLVSDIESQKQIIYFQEKLFEEIKKWWLIDFEEYFNRKVIWTNFSSWHYSIPSWFWNFWVWWNPWILWPVDYWDWFYQCRSWNVIGEKLTWSWCYYNSFNTYWNDVIWEQQKYWQYSFQFIDYNSNYDADWWDEDWDWSIMWDDDDEYLWEGPISFTGWADVKELYLLSWDKKHRTIFKWNVKLDPNWGSATCDFSNGWTPTWSWCLWTIEFLKLEWKDFWLDHNSGSLDLDLSQFDWVIDTWLIDKNFTWWNEIVAWNGTTNYRVSLFPDDINVSNFKVFVYPNTDYDLSWKSSDANINLAPYIRISMSVWPSWEVKRQIKWDPKDIEISTTISLTDIFSK
jgi:hypothetical protein